MTRRRVIRKRSRRRSGSAGIHPWLRRTEGRFGLPPGAIAGAKVEFTFNPRLIRILGERVYTRKADALVREPIQNALDSGASKVRVAVLRLTEGRILVQIRDDGEGMSRGDVSKYLAEIGTTSKEGRLGVTGLYGIGKLAPYMLSEEVYVITRKPPHPVQYVKVAKEGLSVADVEHPDEAEELERIRKRLHELGVDPYIDKGTNFVFVVDASADEWRANLRESDIWESEPVEAMIKLIDRNVGPTRVPVMANGRIVSEEFPNRKGKLEYDLEFSPYGWGDVNVYSDGLFVRRIHVPYLKGRVNYPLKEVLNLAREDFETDTPKKRRIYNAMMNAIEDVRNELAREGADVLGSREKVRLAGEVAKRSREIADEILSKARVNVLDGPKMEERSLWAVGAEKRVYLTTQKRSLELEKLSIEKGAPIVILEDFYDEEVETVKRYLQRRGVRVRWLEKFKARRRREIFKPVEKPTKAQKALTDAIKEVFGVEFEWVRWNRPEYIAAARGEKVYLNASSPAMQELVKAKIPSRVKAMLLMETLSHELAHATTGLTAHTESFYRQMEAVAHRLRQRAINKWPETHEYTSKVGKQLIVPPEILLTDEDYKADVVWLDDRIIAEVGAYEITARVEGGGLGKGAKTIRFRTVDERGRNLRGIPLPFKLKKPLRVTAIKTRDVQPMPYYMHVLMNIHRRRSLQAQVADEAVKAGTVLSPESREDREKWIRQPGRYDIKGVDTPRKERRRE